VSGKVADSATPFDRRLGAGGAVPTGAVLPLAAATAALFENLLTNPSFVTTSFGRHKNAFDSGLNAGASHENHPLSNVFGIKKTGITGRLIVAFQITLIYNSI
jgi:hypothetical protein